jgi:hypothetical protein
MNEDVRSLKQNVVVYDDEEGRACVYTTCYKPDQADRALDQCRHRYPDGACRIVDARSAATRGVEG